MPDSWKHLLALAQHEIAMATRRLPPDLHAHAMAVPVSYESFPDAALAEDGLDGDLLGLFVGDPVGVPDTERFPIPRQIILFLSNIWEFAEEDEAGYREEVRITYLHEFGHYLGLDECDMDERGLK